MITWYGRHTGLPWICLSKIQPLDYWEGNVLYRQRQPRSRWSHQESPWEGVSILPGSLPPGVTATAEVLILQTRLGWGWGASTKPDEAKGNRELGP